MQRGCETKNLTMSVAHWSLQQQGLRGANDAKKKKTLSKNPEV